MKHLIAPFTTLLLALGFMVGAHAQQNAPSLSGLAAYEQLRKEYYIGALYLGWPGHDTQTILAMPGKRQMELRITADRWPALRFAQMWNQSITINNDSATLNNNALDIVAFTSILKGDLQEGDQLIIESEPSTGTRITLNGVLVLHSKSPALFNLILNSWIGSRPPNSEFKRDMLTLPTTPAGTALLARYEAIRPNDARKKAVAAWGIKPELDTPTPATAATVTAAATKITEPAAKPAPTATPTPAPTPASTPAPTTATAHAKASPPPAPKAAAEPVTPQPDPAALAAAQQAKAEKEQQQNEFYSQYLGQIRKQVLRNIDYPRRASKENIEGLVMLRISLDRSGNVTSSEVAQTAHDLLDAAAQSAVKKAAPFPKPPEQLEGNQFQILIPVVFKLAQ